MKSPADVLISIMREKRLASGMTVEDLSNKTGIPAHSIKRWERGGQKPRLQSALLVAAVLGLRIELREAA
jgi:transcriptional regulator with XRE-family HTH domain